MFYIEENGKIVGISEDKSFLMRIFKYRPDLNVKDIKETERNIVSANGGYIFEDEIPEPTIEEQNEEIRKQREARYVAETDELGRDWQEAVARGDENAQQLGQEWVAKKDAIREELPYIVEEEEKATVEEAIKEHASAKEVTEQIVTNEVDNGTI